jgi:hypothetical protein
VEKVTLIIAVAGLLVAIYAAFEARRSAKATEDSARAAEDSAKVTKDSALNAKRSADAAERSIETNIAMFKRQGVMDLYGAWENISDIGTDKEKVIVPDIVKAVRALDFTASLWNHDIVEREIIFQSFWEDYDKLFQKLDSMQRLIPLLNKTGQELLNIRIRRAHAEMKSHSLSAVKQTSVTS